MALVELAVLFELRLIVLVENPLLAVAARLPLIIVAIALLPLPLPLPLPLNKPDRTLDSLAQEKLALLVTADAVCAASGATVVMVLINVFVDM